MMAIATRPNGAHQAFCGHGGEQSVLVFVDVHRAPAHRTTTRSPSSHITQARRRRRSALSCRRISSTRSNVFVAINEL
jgi:hypothetical protein